MQEDMEHGVKLGWLIAPKTRRVAIYRHGQGSEILEFPEKLSGEDILPKFILNLESIW